MPSFAVVMVEPGFDETVGMIARAMKNFGLNDLRLVNPIARLGRRARMRASHAQDVLQNLRAFHSIGDALEDVDLAVGTTAQKARSQYRVLRRPATPKDLAEQLSGAQGSVALVFGREGSGLTNNEVDLCDMIVTIPTSSEYPTLNISHAASILFYELYGPERDGPQDLLAPAATREVLLRFLENSAALAGTNPNETTLAIRAFKNILGRSAVRAREASLLCGVLRSVSNRLAHASLTETASSSFRQTRLRPN